MERIVLSTPYPTQGHFFCFIRTSLLLKILNSCDFLYTWRINTALSISQDLKKKDHFNEYCGLCLHICKQQTWWALAYSMLHVISVEDRKRNAAWVHKLTSSQAARWQLLTTGFQCRPFLEEEKVMLFLLWHSKWGLSPTLYVLLCSANLSRFSRALRWLWPELG